MDVRLLDTLESPKSLRLSMNPNIYGTHYWTLVFFQNYPIYICTHYHLKIARILIFFYSLLVSQMTPSFQIFELNICMHFLAHYPIQWAGGALFQGGIATET
jgi:hypothetical protein